MKYLNRYIEKEIEECLETSGAVVIAGPKWCGKTTTSKRFAKSVYSLDTKDKIMLAEADPEAVLIGDKPRLIDEWQNVPDLWNYARSNIDSSDGKFGQYIFTGSSTPADKKEIYHSGAGRIVTIPMMTMTLSETGESKKIVSLSQLFKGMNKLFYINDGYTLCDTAFYICRGGWPLSLNKDRKKSLKITSNYCSSLFEFENSKNEKFRNKKKEKLITILKSYARNVSTEAKQTTLINDMYAREGEKTDSETLKSYLEALRDLYIIKEIDAWNPNLRSETSIISSPTLHFVDTSIAANILNISPDDLLNDPRTFGLFFEDFAVKELSVYAKLMNGEIRHYRDGDGLECDAVIHLQNSSYCLIEIKLGAKDAIDKAVSTLTRLENKIVSSNRRPPAFKMVLTATGNAYIKDSTYIVPINLLTA